MFGDYDTDVPAGEPIVTHCQSGQPIVATDSGMLFLCETDHPEWGWGRAQRISAPVTLEDGRTQANVRNVLTFSGLGGRAPYDAEAMATSSPSTTPASAPTPERWPHRGAAVAGTTLVVWFFSEMFFVNVGDLFYGWSQRESLPQVLLATAEAVGVWLLFYAFFVLWLLHAIAFFRVRSVWALLFAAAIGGWAIEGSAIPIMYAEMPVALLWPAASWHVLVNVVVGWWLLRKVIETQPFAVVAAVFASLGVVWSLWATWFWPVDEPGSIEASNLPLPPGDFAFVALLSGLLLTLGYVLLDRGGPPGFTPSNRSTVAFAVVGSLLTVLLSQWFAAIFFALVGVACLFLWRNRAHETQPNILSTFRGRSPARNLAAVMLMPAVAAALYPWWYRSSVGIHEVLVPVVGFINLVAVVLFAYGGYRILARRGASEPRERPKPA